MPGIILFKRRWSVGSDDIFIPATIFLILHIVGCVYLLGLVSRIEYDSNEQCSLFMFKYILAYLLTLILILFVEFFTLVLSCRSSILKPSRFLKPFVYFRLILILVELVFIVIGAILLIRYANKCQSNWYDKLMQKTVLAIVVSTSLLMLSILSIIPCVYDKAGKRFYKLKRYESDYKRQPNQSAKMERHLKHEQVLKLYHENWKFRFKLFYCCVKEKKAKNAFTTISEMLACFFYKYDVVPSDLLAGLLLIRDKQKQSIDETLKQRNDIYDYLSGIPITSETKYFNLNNTANLSMYQDMIYFFDYAAASYGWPMYIMNSTNRFACFKLLPNLKNCGVCNQSLNVDSLENINNDNCCFCYYDALIKQLPNKNTNFSSFMMKNTSEDTLESDGEQKEHIKLVHANFSSDVGKPSFFVAVDYFKKRVVVTIRGTESLKDSMTTMQWNAAPIPNTNPSLQWHAHQGYINAACFLKNELESKNILDIAFNFDLSKNTDKYDLLIVGHSYGAGVGSILSILLKETYPTLKCYSYSPLGGILSKSCMEETKDFITTVILGKDMVPRLGIAQLEKLQREVVEALKTTNKPKWKILSSLCCCKCTTESETNLNQIKQKPTKTGTNTTKNKNNNRSSRYNEHASTSSNGFQFSGISCHNNEIIIDKNTKFCIRPSLNNIESTNAQQTRLYPPGRILHVVRKYPRNNINDSFDETKSKTSNTTNKYCYKDTANLSYRLNNSNSSNNIPVYQVIETDNENFNELLISPRMLQDHMPDNLIKCMKAVLEEPAPKKPPRQFKTEEIRFNEYQTLDSIPFIEPEMNASPLLKQHKIAYPNTPLESVLSHQYKNVSEEKLINSAPLAKPESFSDLLNDLDDLTTNLDEHLINTSNMYYDDSMISYKLDGNNNMNSNAREDDLLIKSNLVWWPYTENTYSSTTQNTSLNKTINNKSVKSPNETKKLNNTKNKINIIIENMSSDDNDLNDDLISNRISTSTPRTDSIQECLYTSSSTSNTTSKKQRSSHFLTSCYQYNEYKRLDFNSKFEYDDYDDQFLSLNTPQCNRKFHSSSHDERMHLFSSSYSNSSALSNLLVLNNKASKSLAPNDIQFKDESSMLSLSFSNHIKFSDEYSNKVLSTKASNENNNHNESLNYKSIENMPILKPQSKDYILCFDTSSIDNSSSLVSNDGANSLINSPTTDGFKLLNDSFNSSSNESSYYIYNNKNSNPNNLMSGNDSKNLNNNSSTKIMINNNGTSNITSDNTYKSVLDSCDSGVDTARTLSPYVFSNVVKNTIDQEILNELN